MSVVGNALADAQVRRGRRVVSRIGREEAIVVPIGDTSTPFGSVYTFNQSGAAIWNMIEAGRSAMDIAAYLESEYGISAEQATADTEEFLAALAREGLIEPA
jgi:hypothetical protein